MSLCTESNAPLTSAGAGLGETPPFATPLSELPPRHARLTGLERLKQEWRRTRGRATRRAPPPASRNVTPHTTPPIGGAPRDRATPPRNRHCADPLEGAWVSRSAVSGTSGPASGDADAPRTAWRWLN
ncbi:hypothetical protein JCM18897A_47520 [Streptomyces sp. JCM 18897]